MASSIGIDPFAPYAAAHSSPQGEGDARPTALQIVHDNDRVGAFRGRSALVTGANGAIGFETVRALKATGARVFFSARDQDKVQQVLGRLENSEGDGEVVGLTADLEDLDAVRDMAKKLLSQADSLSIFIANAGVMASPESRTKDGFERQYSVNYLSHLLLFKLLEPALLRGNTPEFASRVVFVSSSGHMASPVVFDNINLDGVYEPWKAYGQSKTAMIWAVNYIDRVYGSRATDAGVIHATSLNPGGIWSNLQQYVDPAAIEGWKSDPKVPLFMKSPAQGAATTLWAAVGKVWEGRGGKYLNNCRIEQPHAEGMQVTDGHASWAYDPASEDKLWQLGTSQLDKWLR
ncbi:putative short-chain dehydrogenase [Auriculariales sp. MPI-PUGE-AT-0066]|nr:putative short-chain dehydrogenase [Auriculariales sp. MPI-PUGE-AT-0066]